MTEPTLSDRAMRTPPSPIRRLAHVATAARQAGVEVYHLNIGQPDLATPPEFFQGLDRARREVLAYEPSAGNPQLRRAWCEYVNRTLDLDTTPDQHLVTMGASEALVFVFMLCCNPGDEVIVFDPTYANYLGFAAVAGVTLVPVLSRLDEGFRLPDDAAIRACITPRTRAILLCNPNNPTGTVYDRQPLASLIELCNARNLFLIADETYRELVFDGRRPLSVLQLDGANDRIVVIDSLSKRFSLCGARIGTLTSTNTRFMAKALNLAQARLAAPTLEQAAAAYMLGHLPEDYIDGVRRIYQQRRDVLCAQLRAIPGVAAHLPSGAFYTVARLPVDCAEHFTAFMLAEFREDNRTVFLAPAAGFYMGGDRGQNKVRIAFVLNPEDLNRAMHCLRSGLAQYTAPG